MEQPLYNLLVSAQQGCKESELALLRKFEPLLKKYAWYLSYEDALQDLQLGFLQLIQKWDTKRMEHVSDYSIIAYLHKAVSNLYIALSKKAHREKNNSIPFSSCSESSLTMLENKNSSQDSYDGILCNMIHDTLPEAEYKIILWHYVSP